jgi:hypothetical protein
MLEFSFLPASLPQWCELMDVPLICLTQHSAFGVTRLNLRDQGMKAGTPFYVLDIERTFV